MLDGPMIFLSRAMRAPATLGTVVQFAKATRRNLRILVQMPGRIEESLLKKRISMWRESLPTELQYLPIEGVRSTALRPTLHAIAQKSAGLITLIPSRRGNPTRAFSHNDYETLLIEGPLPVLALPKTGELPTVKTILFPIDLSPRSDAVLDQTLVLCKDLGCSLHLLHVYGDDRLLPAEMDMEQRLAAKSPRELFAIDQAHIKKLAEHANDNGVITTAATAEGRAHEQIGRYVKEQSIDLVVMATHGPRNSTDIFLGSTTIRTILKSPVPVIGVQC
jgi:nucleotide-binding universal stress UspA family protein